MKKEKNKNGEPSLHPGENRTLLASRVGKKEAFKVPNDIETLKTKPKFYVLGMFPYTSGAGFTWDTPKTMSRPMYSPIFGGCRAIT